MILITDYIPLNKQLAQNAYTITRINKKIQQLEGFQYDNMIDLNIGYDKMQLCNQSRDMKTILIEFGN